MYTDTMPAETRAGFLDGFAAIHQAMRRDARRLPAAIADVDDRRAARHLERWYRSFHAAIDHHHRREDDLVWPELRRRDGSFGDHIAELAEDHHALEAALDEVAAGLRRLVAEGPDRRAEVVVAAETLATILHDHLRREEEAAFGRIGRVFLAEEYEALEHEMRKGLSLGDMAFLAPWTFDGLEPTTVDRMLAPLPAIVRFLVRTVFTRRYRRLAAPLLAVAP
jgi:iron-sulfur cluster repair protein YtfE (RIC family)